MGRAASGAAVERVTPCVPVLLPRGRMDVRLRIVPYANGSMGLELQDFEGTPFYWPTIPFSLASLADALPGDLDESAIVAMKPSATRCGIADALVAAGLLSDLGVEVPVDRAYARLMRVEFRAAERLAAAAMREEPEAEAFRLKPVPVGASWKPTVKRVQAALMRRGMEVSEEAAMLGWALASGQLPGTPRPLPAAAEAIAAALLPWLEPDRG
ncbi:hypothetical protein [Thermaurantiacus sp.]